MLWWRVTPLSKTDFPGSTILLHCVSLSLFRWCGISVQWSQPQVVECGNRNVMLVPSWLFFHRCRLWRLGGGGFVQGAVCTQSTRPRFLSLATLYSCFVRNLYKL